MKISSRTKTILQHIGTGVGSAVAGALLGGSHPGWVTIIQTILGVVGGSN